MARLDPVSDWSAGHAGAVRVDLRPRSRVSPCPLALACQEAGYDVLWATNVPAVSLVELAGIRCAEAGLSGEALANAVSRLQARAGQLALPDAPPSCSRPCSARRCPSRWPPTSCRWHAISSRTCWCMNKGELASPLVADVLGVSSLTHSFGGSVPTVFVAEASKRLSGLWQEHGLRQPPFTGCYQAPHLDICPPSVQTVLLLHIPVVQPLRPISWSGPAATFEPTDDPRPTTPCLRHPRHGRQQPRGSA